MEWTDLSLIVGIAVTVIIVGMAALILFLMFSGRINLDTLLIGSDGTASLARFQFLLFTFVVAGIYLVLCLESGTLLEIPPTVLGLLGISGGSYIVSKGISETTDKDVQVAEITGLPPGGAAAVTPPRMARQQQRAAEQQMDAARAQQQAAEVQERAANIEAGRDPNAPRE